MAVPAPTNFQLVNPGFETGNFSGWTYTPIGGTASPSIDTARPFMGQYAALWEGGSGSGHEGGIELIWVNDAVGTVGPGQSVTASLNIALNDTDASQNRGEVRLMWYDENNSLIGYHAGNLVRGNNEAWRVSTVTASAPPNAQYVRFGAWTTANAHGDSGVLIDNAVWNYQWDNSGSLTSPATGANYVVGDEIPLRVTTQTSAGYSVKLVEYLADGAVIATSNVAPYATNYDGLDIGTYDITARITFSDNSQIVTNAASITVGAAPVPPETREFKASNSYTFLVAENFQGLGAAIPATAVVTGVEILIDADMEAIIRAKDIGVADPSVARYSAFFDMVQQGRFEVAMFQKGPSAYTMVGSPITSDIVIDRTQFTVAEEGISDGKRYVHLTGASTAVTIGSETALFGVSPISAPDFINNGIGIRFYPILSPKPAFADSGDGVLRMLLDSFKLRVYFDAGSVEYFFASPDKTQVIKGELVHSYVMDGNFSTADASGVMELLPTLEVVDGTQTYIGDDWTIHSAYPVNDDNQIGEVAPREQNDGIGMSYNGLHVQQAVMDNRSRYQIITNNFYGDPNLEGMYGATGLSRAFAYNGKFFHRIYTQPDPVKDSPRHVAHHHEHLALGFGDGRVDISVVGEPYNFDGSQGASSWAIGDGVTGLLSLSGTILGVFCKKSIWGISGTTVDNFATQVIVPKLGAIEYTITDMGFPVYANAYGIYTLAQATEYGDYLGTPMSQDVSPWLRPRLLRKYTSNKEVVVAWPVRSKNQYRLCFADGYVLSMTLNAGSQSAPTFSFQRYDLHMEEPVGPAPEILLTFNEGEDINVTANDDLIPATWSQDLVIMDNNSNILFHVWRAFPGSLDYNGVGDGQGIPPNGVYNNYLMVPYQSGETPITVHLTVDMSL